MEERKQAGEMRSKYSTLWLCVIVSLLAIVLFSAWQVGEANRNFRTLLLQQSQKMADTLDLKQISALTGTTTDLNLPEYQEIKRQLSFARHAYLRYRFISLMGKDDKGNFIVLVDSESPNSKDYSPPGDIYYEADSDLQNVFLKGESFINKMPIKDRWGSWISAFVPLKDPVTGKILAVLTIDIPASGWYETIIRHSALRISLGTLILVLGFLLFIQWNNNRLVKKQNQELMESENRLRSYLLNAPISVFILDDCENFLEVNPECTQLTGYTIDELKKMCISDLLAPEVKSTDSMVLKNVVRTGKGYGEMPFIRKDGSRRLVFAAAVRLSEWRYLAFVQDITEQKAAETQLRYIQSIKEILISLSGKLVSASAFELDDVIRTTLAEAGNLFKVDRSSIVRFDWDLGIMGISHEWCAEGAASNIKSLQNIPMDKYIGLINTVKSEPYIHIPDVSQLPDPWNPVRDLWNTLNIVSILIVPLTEKDKVIGFISFVSVGKKRVWLEDEIELLKLMAVNIRRAISRIRVEQALVESERNYREIFNSTNEAIFIDDKNGRMIDVNDTMIKMYGYDSKEEVLTGNIGDLSANLPPYTEEKAQEYIRKAICEGPQTFEWLAKKKDGTVFPVEMSLRKSDVAGEIRILAVGRDISERKQLEQSLQDYMQSLKESEERLRTLMNSMPDIVCFKDGQGRWLEANEYDLRLFQIEHVDYRGKKDSELAAYSEFYRDAFMACEQSDEITWQTRGICRGEERIPCPDGSAKIFDIIKLPLFNEDGSRKGLVVVGRDITSRKLATEALQQSEEHYRSLVEHMVEGMGILTFNGKILFFNLSAVRIFGFNSVEEADLAKKEISDLIDPVSLPQLSLDVKRVHNGEDVSAQYRFNRPDGELGWLEVSGTKVTYMDQDAILVLFHDITDRKRAEDQAKYLSLHDSLTGLYNRTYFEEEMNRLEQYRHSSMGVIVFDVDGLKLINDTLGHTAGDNLLLAVSNLLRDTFRQGEVMARIGGDEFTVLLPEATMDALGNIVQRIREKLHDYNQMNPELPMSISIGLAAGSESDFSVNELFRQADNNMYRDKLRHRQSSRSSIVQTLMKALETRDFLTKGHADRLQNLAVAMARKLGFAENQINDLVLFTEFHDIGKVGVPDRILFKPGPLDQEEMAEMQRHCEMGYRIALASPDLTPIADWILKHQEWWNGQGYPLGLSGEQIPLECRILSIVDAYDAMVSDRPYRKGIPHDKAVQELKMFSGTQFDPSLIELFLNIIDEHRTN